MIRPAQNSDLESIYYLFKNRLLDTTKLNDLSYQMMKQKEGFIIGEDTKSDFESYIKDDPFFFVFESEGEVIGFICGYYDPCYLGYWFDNKTKRHFYTAGRTYIIDRLIIDKNNTHQQVGTKLLSYFEHELKKNNYVHLFSYVKIHPLINYPSLQFHIKNNFRSVSISLPEDKKEGVTIVSLLFYKKL